MFLCNSIWLFSSVGMFLIGIVVELEYSGVKKFDWFVLSKFFFLFKVL